MDAEDLIPARMVNECVYCPSLLYLKWVQVRFANNDDTRIGRQAQIVTTGHRRWLPPTGPQIV
ncbi:hypothetical protein [Nocardia alni]|uniref:hypothetical protein n=1 Tax=Nocardia alni TaxID=2815723 RepID=UPI001C236D59|nr:hypothetical protein [Nocardia alni]